MVFYQIELVSFQYTLNEDDSEKEDDRVNYICEVFGSTNNEEVLIQLFYSHFSIQCFT